MTIDNKSVGLSAWIKGAEIAIAVSENGKRAGVILPLPAVVEFAAKLLELASRASIAAGLPLPDVTKDPIETYAVQPTATGVTVHPRSSKHILASFGCGPAAVAFTLDREMASDCGTAMILGSAPTPEAISVQPPVLDVDAVPERERPAALLALAHLNNLHSYVRDFEWALALFELCTEFKGVIKTDWSFVAARDGAMTIYHFAKTFEILNKYVAESPSLKAGSDKVAIKRAGKALREFFPQIDVLRDTIAHDGELKNTTEKAARHPLRGPIRVGTLLIGNEAAQVEIKAIAGDQLVLTKAGSLVGYRLNRAALGVLKQVAKEVSSAIRVGASKDAASESVQER